MLAIDIRLTVWYSRDRCLHSLQGRFNFDVLRGRVEKTWKTKRMTTKMGLELCYLTTVICNEETRLAKIGKWQAYEVRADSMATEYASPNDADESS
jgi:hypothetical protein